ncbi:sensor histidine kinase [Vibrio metschnikovii]|uniref:sensor histidine kinase n=1 Tax=Vibrio metschnikovii TaxID=28172 RepID=UPI002FCB2A18
MARFQVLARTLVHLGSELITSDSIAIYELIKNAIDARSKDVKVTFIINFNQKVLDDIYDKWTRLKETSDWKRNISDDLDYLLKNHLMSEDDSNVENIFNEIKTSYSINEAAEKLLKINYITVTDSGCGMSKEELETTFLTLGTNNKLNKEIEGQPYLGNKGIGRISMMRLGRCSEIISWKDGDYANQITFDWRDFEDPLTYLDDISIFSKKVDSDSKSDSGTIIKITHLKGQWSKNDVKSQFIDGFLRKLRNPFDVNGYKFPIHVYYNGGKEKNRLPIKALDEKLWQLAQRTLIMDFEPKGENYLSIAIKDEKDEDRTLPYKSTNEMLLHELSCDASDIEKLGKLSLKIKWFNRRILVSDIKNQGLSSRSQELKKELDLWSGGIAIYRDGFRIGNSGDFNDKDWFDIDKGALRGQGFTLNRIQIIGALEISQKENKYLMDRSNREGLIENVQMRILKKIINEVILPLLRDTINQDKKNDGPVELSKLIKRDIENSDEKLTSIRKNISSIINSVTPEQKKVLNEAREELHNVSNQIKGFESMVGQLKEQREDILVLAGTGTMTHVVMHELARSTGQTRDLLNQVAKEDSSPKLNKLIRKLEQEIKAINARIRQFDPLSISGKNRKTRFELVDFIKTIISGYENKAQRHNIDIRLLVDGEQKEKIFYVEMVKGFVAIALENLLSNSCYWLNQNDAFKKYIYSIDKKIIIDIDTDSKTVSVWDSGVGIAYCDRERIFIPGYTTKKSNRDGKGFGLFIAKEVSKYQHGDVYLDVEEDKNKRLRRFVIELPKE